MKLAWSLVLALALAVPAAADEVVLRNGGRLVGQVVRQTSSAIVFEVEGGEVTLPRAHVETLVAGPTPLSEYRERAAGLAVDDAAGWLHLAQWAQGERLDKPARQAFEQVLHVDPNNAAANEALGRTLVDGRWLTEDESYQARGYVRFEQRWVLPEEREAVLRERAVDDDRERSRSARVEAEARAREAEARLHEAEARAREAEARARAAEHDDGRRADASCHPSSRRHASLAYGVPREGVVYSICNAGGASYLCEGAPGWRFHERCGQSHVPGQCPLDANERPIHDERRAHAVR
jgi:hypothetical protein